MENEKEIKIEKINDLMWKIEKTGSMNIPVLILASEKLIKKMKEDRTFYQAQNMATLPGVLKNIIVLSDAHEGYGACIGGVAAYDSKRGVISPGEIGYDINCSVRLLKTNLKKEDIEKNKKKILDVLYEMVPSGVGRGGKFNISREKFKDILVGGAQW
ncbi:MAG: RtcB family protein, partial [Nanoarchaeota archaeon]